MTTKLLKNNNWNNFFSQILSKKYFQLIIQNIDKFANEIYPKKEDIFRIFEFIKINEIKVIIIGQDPYHNLNQANGIAFGVNNGITPPPSLKNISKELFNEYNRGLDDYTLISWVKQGVFLINAIWTVFKNSPFSCNDWGWDIFCKDLLEYICSKKDNIIFVCFGNWAFKFVKSINLKNIIVLKTSHPSPLSANKGFFGSNIFKNVNYELSKLNTKIIKWC